MSSPLKITEIPNDVFERLLLEMGKRLQLAAAQSVREKLASGEIKIVDGRYVGESLKVQRPLKVKPRPKKPDFKVYR